MVFCGHFGLAGEVFEFYNGIRQMGMGGASIAVVNDETAIVANPAGLGKVRDLYLTIFDPEFDATTNGSQMINAGNLTGITEPQGLLNILNSYPGKYFYAKTQVMPSIVLPNFGFGILGKIEVAGEVTDSATPAYQLHYTNDLGAVLAYNLRLLDGRIKFGFSGRFVNRVQIINEDLDETSLTLRKDELAVEGGGIGIDGGLVLSLPWAWIPTLGLMVHDFGGTNYSLTGGMFYRSANRPETVPQSVDAAIALFPIIGNRTRASFTVEYRDVTTASTETDHYRRAHLGLELNFNDILFTRVGMNGRYWTAGIEFALQRLQFQAATYGEEIGTAESPRQDRRMMLKFAFRL